MWISNHQTALSTYGDINTWNVSQITDMSFLFKDKTTFGSTARLESGINDDISNWDTSNVTNMYGMFWNASEFNNNIGNWNTGNVTSLLYTFLNATAFNQDIGSWDVSKVTAMNLCSWCYAFNQDIGSWNTSNVTNMSGMFTFGTWASPGAFNQDISTKIINQGTSEQYTAWDTSKVTSMLRCF